MTFVRAARFRPRDSLMLSPKGAQAPGTGTFPSKRPFPERDAPSRSKEHDSEICRSPKRPRRSGFDSRCSPRLESDGTYPTPAYPSANGSVSQSSQIPENASLQFPRTPAPRAVSSPAPTGGGISLADIKQLLEDQTKQLLESQIKQISLLTAEVESLKRKVSSGSQVEKCASDDGDSDSDSDIDSTELKSAQRRKWTTSEEELLRQLKYAQSNNDGMPSDHAIAKKLKRSVDGVKQHWTIMQKIGGRTARGTTIRGEETRGKLD
ncbi:Coronin-like protein crn1 [Fusarium falciforme]|nr:Coronin-like protein crn1 [Fusarium falciforme]KAJ4227870.1 Coronin-like protein crn1 [Fusarium falciforme]